MLKVQKRSCNFSDLRQSLPVWMFLLAVVVSVITTWHVTGHILDADASSEMVLAKQLSETHSILSRDWMYSTELRVLNSQLFFAFFFHFLEDWHLVRFFSAISLQALMVLSYGFMLKKTGFQWKNIWIGSAMILLPASVTYGRIVLYHSHYIIHLCLAFFIVGMIAGTAEEFSFKKAGTYLRLALLLGLSFVGGLAGVRHLMVIFAPLLLAIVLLCFVEDFRSGDAQTAALISFPKLQFLVPTVLTLAASMSGVVINSSVLRNIFSFSQYTDTSLAMMNPNRLTEVVYGFFHQFGYRQSLSMLSFMGILSLLALVAGSYCVVSSIKRILNHKKEDSFAQAIIHAFFLCFTVVMLALFFLTDGSGNYAFYLYLSLIYPWAVTLVISEWIAYKGKMHPLNVKCIFNWLTVACFVFNTMANLGFFFGMEAFQQTYEGLWYKNIQCVAEKEAAVAYLCDNDYTVGYSTYWNGNVMTEMSDGKIQMINLKLDRENGNVYYYDWLTSLYVREIPVENYFVLITRDEAEAFAASEIFSFCTPVYEDTYHHIYRIDGLEENLLYS